MGRGDWKGGTRRAGRGVCVVWFKRPPATASRVFFFHARCCTALHTMDKQREEYKAVFDMFDKDGDGTITTTELAGIFGKLGAEIDQDKLDILVKQVDANSDGCIDFEEFMQLMNELVGGEDTDDDLKSAFKIRLI